ILGPQRDDYRAIYNQIEGNGAQFLHVIQSDEDSLISNGFIMGVPVFKDFSVDVYIENGVQYQTRKGTFFNLNSKGRTPIKMIRPIFDRIRVSANSDEFGYENIFKIDGNQMADNGLVKNGYYATFKHFFNSSNNEAVNWKF